MRSRITVLGVGFGGLELCTLLSEELGDTLEVTLIDKAGSFVKPGVRFLPETVTAIDPPAARVTTDAGTHESDYLVIALGADYDFDATPVAAAEGNEFYSAPGRSACAQRVRASAARPAHHAGITQPMRDRDGPAARKLGTPVARRVEGAGRRVRGAQHQIRSQPSRDLARSRAPGRGARRRELSRDLFLGVPKHCASKLVQESGVAGHGWVSVTPRTLETRFRGVCAIGDIASTGAPKAGAFAGWFGLRNAHSGRLRPDDGRGFASTKTAFGRMNPHPRD